mgnify:CR=1 FL=1
MDKRLNLHALRSSYDVNRSKGKVRFPSVVVIPKWGFQPDSLEPTFIHRRRKLKHEKFETPTEALQYATLVRKRLIALTELLRYDEALCLCGHDQGVHRDVAGVGRCRMGDGCECARFVWVWSQEAHERIEKRLGVVTLSEVIDA